MKTPLNIFMNGHIRTMKDGYAMYMFNPQELVEILNALDDKEPPEVDPLAGTPDGLVG